MSIPSIPSDDAPLLKYLVTQYPGSLYGTASKAHIESGLLSFRKVHFTGAVWLDAKTGITLTFADGSKTTLLLDNGDLSKSCTCRQWQPASNCPHVVMLWLALKRLVSPEYFKLIPYDDQFVSNLNRFIQGEPLTFPEDGGADIGAQLLEKFAEARRRRMEGSARGAITVEQKKRKEYRLLLQMDTYTGTLKGTVKAGETSLNSWSTAGIPADLTRFLVTHYNFDPSSRYLRDFISMTKGKYPVVFCDEAGSETVLTFRADQAVTAGVLFDTSGSEVCISCTYGDGTPLPDDAIISEDLLYTPAAGFVAPVLNHYAWKNWESVARLLSGLKSGIPDDHDYWDDDVDEPGSSMLYKHSVAVSFDQFNASRVTIDPDALRQPDLHVLFRINGQDCSSINFSTPEYLLDIPEGMANRSARLVPLLTIGEQNISFDESVAAILNPEERSLLPSPLRAKKRLRLLIEAAFALLQETTAKGKTSLIRSVTSTPDFSKRTVKRDSKLLIERLSSKWREVSTILLAGPGGWTFVDSQNARQSRLLEILYTLFGLDAFIADGLPGEMEVETATLLKHLPLLLEKLTAASVSLRIGKEPLARAEWTFSIDATVSSLDWFELKPEIRCNGDLLTPEELAGLFSGDGILRRDGKLLMLDDLSAQVMGIFSGSLHKGKAKKKRGEHEPVRVPRLQILDWLQLRTHGVEIRLAPEDARILDSLLNFASIPERPLPGSLKATLRHYQKDAWCWLTFLYEHRFGACLADDMGLGKTLQGISLIAGILAKEIVSAAPAGTPHLVVAPPSLLFNWEAEIARFLPSARTYLYAGTERSVECFAAADIIITSYGIVQRDHQSLSKRRFDVIIFDETQVVKNLQAATSNAVRTLQGVFNLALTGTPLENHLGEYYAIMDLALPGLLGTREEFSRSLGKNGAEATHRLTNRTRPFVLRRTKALIADELPPKTELDIRLELTSKQKFFYQRMVEEVRTQVKDAYESHAPAQARIIALTAILRLRQICLAPSLAAKGADSGSPKFEFLVEQLEELRDEGHSALVFSQFTSYLDMIESGFRKKGVAYLRLDGSTPVPQRKKLVQSFQGAKEPMAFLISLKAGGRGLNLTRASYVYHMDPWWNPAVENQASDRAHRIGQKEQVTVTRLIMRHTIEEKMMELKARKLELYRALLEEGESKGGAALSREDFEFLLG